MKEGKTQRQMAGWSKTEYDQPWTERRGFYKEGNVKKLSFGGRKTTTRWGIIG
jgi:hypothetical protein